MPGAGSEALKIPNDSELQAFARSVDAALRGELKQARSAAKEAGYRFEVGGPIRAWLPASKHGRGSYFLRDPAKRSLSISAPHPKFDMHTAELATRAFAALDARALSVAGTHRCANAAPSAAGGTTKACGKREAYRVSDMAHVRHSVFHTFHRRMVKGGTTHHVQIHGKAGANPRFSVSDGTAIDAPAAHPSNVLAGHLGDGSSCNRAGDVDTLCGLENVQGKDSGGAVFLHVELSLAVREQPAAFVAALAKTVPERAQTAPSTKP